MSYDFVIDSYAWIEYFMASKPGEQTRRYIEEEESATPTIVVAELSRKFFREIEAGRETHQGREARLSFLRTSSLIVDLDADLAELAGGLTVTRRKQVEGWGLADSIILATARRQQAKVVTGDQHFKDLNDEVIMIR